MFYKKAIWLLRGGLYKFLFKEFKLPSYIGNPMYIGGFKKILIGKQVRIYPGARIEVFDKGRLIIQDNVGIAQNVQITCSGEDLLISKGTVILANTFVTNIDHTYDNINLPILDQEISVKRTFIGENCFIGIGCAIQAGTVLGKHCIVGANSVVRGKFPDYCVIVGVPGKIVKRYNSDTERWEKTNPNGTFKA